MAFVPQLATVSDGKTAPVTLFDTRNLSITDATPPAAPSGLTALALPRSAQANWNPNTEKDLAGCEIGYGFVNEFESFIYTRTMGDKEPSPAALARGPNLRLANRVDGDASVTQFDGKLWGHEDGQPVFVGVRDYDESGNFSPWTLAPGAPWSLSPQGFARAGLRWRGGVGSGRLYHRNHAKRLCRKKKPALLRY